MTTVAYFFSAIFVICHIIFLGYAADMGMVGGMGGGCGSANTDSGLIGAFTARCDSQGNYLAEQCHSSTGFCWCVLPNGQEIPNTRIGPTGQRKNCDNERRNYNGGGNIVITGCTGSNCGSNQQQCSDPNSAWNSCPPACEDSCYGKPADCGMGPSSCIPGCSCKPGYIRQGASNISPCVTRAQCSSTGNNNNNNVAFQQQCNDQNEVFQQCPPPCEESCLGKPADCGMMVSGCTPGCTCRPGYVRQGASILTPCIPRQQCGSNPITTGTGFQPCTGTTCTGRTGTGTCSDPNAQYTQCGSACPETCQGAPMMCSMNCIQGCSCKPGYVKQSNAPNALCLLKSQCITTGTGNQPCTGTTCTGTGTVTGYCSDPNAKWSQCGTACPDTCQGSPSVCTMQCVMGCVCNTGYVKQTSAQNSICVRRDQCTTDGNPTGGYNPNMGYIPNQGYNPNGGYIPNMGNNYNLNGGYVPCSGNMCNNMATNNGCTDMNSVFSQCGAGCQTNCQSQNMACGYQCVQGCICKPGFIKLTSATNAPCVRQNQCNSYSSGFRFARFF